MSTIHLQALELAAAGNWDAAHRLIQDYSDTLACQVHGYLHRVEGDDWNAGYWYKRASISMPANTLEEEFERLSGLAGRSA